MNPEARLPLQQVQSRRALLLGAVGGAAALTAAGQSVSAAQQPRKLVLVAGAPSHPTLMHEFRAGCLLLQKCLRGVPGLETTLHTGGWPDDPRAFDRADAVFLYMDGGGNHPAIQGDRLQVLEGLARRGAGLGFAHYALEVPAEKAGRQWQEWVGGHYEHLYSVNPMWEPEIKALPEHPITRGVKPFRVKDEWYFNMRFRPELRGITPILTAVPSDAVRRGPYVYPAGPYDHIVAASGREELLLWAVERPDGGRGFGFTGGHGHLNWGDPSYRKLVLNALVWLTKLPVPRQGVESTVTRAELYQNLDDKPNRPTDPPEE
ncbi:MAG: ThuA domain-containing protein [Armatimonadota bacterium]